MLAMVAAVLSGRTVFAGDKYALIISGASGGDAYAQKYQTWRVSFTNMLREKFGYEPERLLVLAESESEGVQKATREQVQRVFAELRKKLTKTISCWCF